MPRWRVQSNRAGPVLVEVCWRPLDGEVAGDFHDLIHLRDGRILALLGDAPGFGAPAAELADQLRFEFRRFMRTNGDPAAALSHLDGVLSAHGDVIATVVCAAIDPVAGVVETISAGHLPVLVRTGAGGAHFLDVPVFSPLGVPDERRSVRQRLAPNDVLVFFTDGLIERRDRRLDEELAALRLLAEDLGPGRSRPDELARRATERLGPPTDDVTVMSVRLVDEELAIREPAQPAVRLRLYVHQADLGSAGSEEVVRQLAAQLSGRVEVLVEVVDLTAAGGRADEDRVMATPTVVRLSPLPVMRVIGRLRSAAELARALQLPVPEENLPDVR